MWSTAAAESSVMREAAIAYRNVLAALRGGGMRHRTSNCTTQAPSIQQRPHLACPTNSHAQVLSALL